MTQGNVSACRKLLKVSDLFGATDGQAQSLNADSIGDVDQLAAPTIRCAFCQCFITLSLSVMAVRQARKTSFFEDAVDWDPVIIEILDEICG